MVRKEPLDLELFARKAVKAVDGYDALFADVIAVIEGARRAAARSVNAVMTATYWLVGRRIVEAEQAGKACAGYGEELIERLAQDVTSRFGGVSGAATCFRSAPSIWRTATFSRRRLDCPPPPHRPRKSRRCLDNLGSPLLFAMRPST